MLRLHKSKLFPTNEAIGIVFSVQMLLIFLKVRDYVSVPWTVVMMPLITIAVIFMAIVLLITGLAIGITIYRRFMDK